MDSNDLTVDVYVAPMRPFAGSPARGPGDDPMWSPMSSTLIAGAEEAILVDTLVTRDQVDSLADWVRGFKKRITGVYITHGHQDHWIGLARLQEHFPEARGIATAEVVERARFEASDPSVSAYWKASFPGELPQTAVLPEPLSGTQFELEGQILRAVSLSQGDTEFSTVLHVPSAAAVIGGDVVYNGVHMMTAETDEQSREAWISSLNAVAALNPKVVVAGHKSVGAPDLPESIGASQQYLRDFSRIVNEGGGAEDIVNAMLELHGDRDNPRTLWHSARTAVAKRG
ncbi:MBL fold metallo-hydrolase [Arthrobacter sp. BE255]|uniref:MBL fold metallo-hydrolase n=1 Tax=Arthrobacter sp. BE255 TaxID=2817721 RepID=UPI002858784B|nr:MBL fold metallo-hydrolase [Arthrobacter sp. BE255]MDR7159158.1 glyoxylase-like metal-dependent hydrolase (beta-lactamase superfamily II) [Arthrobacter sp. BE255]